MHQLSPRTPNIAPTVCHLWWNIIGALDTTDVVEFDDNGISFSTTTRPEAWQVEGGYTTEIGHREIHLAVGNSGTGDLGGAFPESRFLVTVGRWLFDDMRWPWSMPTKRTTPHLREVQADRATQWQRSCLTNGKLMEYKRVLHFFSPSRQRVVVSPA